MGTRYGYSIGEMLVNTRGDTWKWSTDELPEDFCGDRMLVHKDFPDIRFTPYQAQQFDNDNT